MNSALLETAGPIQSDNSGDTEQKYYCYVDGKVCKHHYFHDKHYDYCKAQRGHTEPSSFMTPLRNGWMRLRDEHPNPECPFLTKLPNKEMSNVH